MSDEESIRVAIADDQSLFAGGIARILATKEGIEVVGEAHDGEEAVSLCIEREPDVVLMDISMPGMDGVTATRKIKDLSPSTAILILTVHTDDAFVFQGIKAGAQGYLLKDCSAEELMHAIQTVYNGSTIMSQDIARKMLSTFEQKPPEAEISPSLTERELQVIRSLAQGLSNKQIARALDISEKTVRNYASNLYKKLHIFDRTQAVLYAIRTGIVDPDDPGRERSRSSSRIEESSS